MEVKLKNAHPALLVLDLQELFTSAKGPFSNNADELISNVNNTWTVEVASVEAIRQRVENSIKPD